MQQMLVYSMFLKLDEVLKAYCSKDWFNNSINIDVTFVFLIFQCYLYHNRKQLRIFEYLSFFIVRSSKERAVVVVTT